MYSSIFIFNYSNDEYDCFDHERYYWVYLGFYLLLRCARRNSVLRLFVNTDFIQNSLAEMCFSRLSLMIIPFSFAYEVPMRWDNLLTRNGTLYGIVNPWYHWLNRYPVCSDIHDWVNERTYPFFSDFPSTTSSASSIVKFGSNGNYFATILTFVLSDSLTLSEFEP